MNLDLLKKDKKLLRFVFEKIFTFGDLDKNYEDLDATVSNIFCCFHDDKGKPSAKVYYDETRGIDVIHCFKENRQFTSYDFLTQTTYRRGDVVEGIDAYDYLINHADMNNVSELISSIEKGYLDYNSNLLEDKINYIDNLYEDVDANTVDYIEDLYTMQLKNLNLVDIDGVNILKGYIDLYNMGLDIKSEIFYNFLSKYLKKENLDKDVIKSVTETYNILTQNSTLIKVINRDKVYKQISMLESTQLFKDNKTLKMSVFLSKNKYFYIIPLQTIKGTIVGFIFRSLFRKKDKFTYFTYSFQSDMNEYTKQIPLMYGFYKDFEDYDIHENCKPIVVCEGLKDCICLKKLYPYTLANNTSKLRFNAHILRNLTNKIILVYDNDNTGIAATKSDTSKLESLGFNVCSINLNSMGNSFKNFKDISELTKDTLLLEKFNNKFMKTINDLTKYN